MSKILNEISEYHCMSAEEVGKELDTIGCHDEDEFVSLDEENELPLLQINCETEEVSTDSNDLPPPLIAVTNPEPYRTVSGDENSSSESTPPVLNVCSSYSKQLLKRCEEPIPDSVIDALVYAELAPLQRCLDLAKQALEESSLSYSLNRSKTSDSAVAILSNNNTTAQDNCTFSGPSEESNSVSTISFEDSVHWNHSSDCRKNGEEQKSIGTGNSEADTVRPELKSANMESEDSREDARESSEDCASVVDKNESEKRGDLRSSRTNGHLVKKPKYVDGESHFKCWYCSCKTDVEMDIVQHLTVIHPLTIYKYYFSSQDPPENINTENRFKCGHCSLSSFAQSNIKEHCLKKHCLLPMIYIDQMKCIKIIKQTKHPGQKYDVESFYKMNPKKTREVRRSYRDHESVNGSANSVLEKKKTAHSFSQNIRGDDINTSTVSNSEGERQRRKSSALSLDENKTCDQDTLHENSSTEEKLNGCSLSLSSENLLKTTGQKGENRSVKFNEKKSVSELEQLPKSNRKCQREVNETSQMEKNFKKTSSALKSESALKTLEEQDHSDEEIVVTSDGKKLRKRPLKASTENQRNKSDRPTENTLKKRYSVVIAESPNKVKLSEHRNEYNSGSTEEKISNRRSSLHSGSFYKNKIEVQKDIKDGVKRNSLDDKKLNRQSSSSLESSHKRKSNSNTFVEVEMDLNNSKNKKHSWDSELESSPRRKMQVLKQHKEHKDLNTSLSDDEPLVNRSRLVDLHVPIARLDMVSVSRSSRKSETKHRLLDTSTSDEEHSVTRSNVVDSNIPVAKTDFNSGRSIFEKSEKRDLSVQKERKHLSKNDSAEHEDRKRHRERLSSTQSNAFAKNSEKWKEDLAKKKTSLSKIHDSFRTQKIEARNGKEVANSQKDKIRGTKLENQPVSVQKGFHDNLERKLRKRTVSDSDINSGKVMTSHDVPESPEIASSELKRVTRNAIEVVYENCPNKNINTKKRAHSSENVPPVPKLKKLSQNCDNSPEKLFGDSADTFLPLCSSSPRKFSVKASSLSASFSSDDGKGADTSVAKEATVETFNDKTLSNSSPSKQNSDRTSTKWKIQFKSASKVQKYFSQESSSSETLTSVNLKSRKSSSRICSQNSEPQKDLFTIFDNNESEHSSDDKQVKNQKKSANVKDVSRPKLDAAKKEVNLEIKDSPRKRPQKRSLIDVECEEPLPEHEASESPVKYLSINVPLPLLEKVRRLHTMCTVEKNHPLLQNVADDEDMNTIFLHYKGVKIPVKYFAACVNIRAHVRVSNIFMDLMNTCKIFQGSC